MKMKIGIVVVVGILLLGVSTLAGIHALFPGDGSLLSPVTSLQQNEVYDLVIIAPSEFSSELQPLIDHKNSHNVQTILKTTEEVYAEYHGRDEAEQIKYFIKDVIERWAIRFVLLVGGAEQLPGRYTHIYYDDYNLFPTPAEWIFLSDMYYADVYDAEGNFCSWDSNGNDVFAEYDWEGNFDELDLYPDVYIGRLACINNEEVATCVNKIITYETTEAYKQNWFTNLVLIGGDSLLGDTEQIDEGEFVNEKVIEIMDGFIPMRIWASNGKLYQASNINDAVNNGASFVFFNGHGNVDMWATHPHEQNIWIPHGSYTNSHIWDLSNGYKLPIVISDACYHCKYDARSDCFGWTFVKNPDGGGIAFIGGTDIDLSYGGRDIITKGVEKICLEMSTHYKGGIATLGELWGKSLTTYMSSEIDEIDLIIVTENHLFGDPSLTIAGKSQPPKKPNPPEGPPSGKAGTEYTYEATATDPDGDQIYYLFNWGDGTDSGWIGPHDSGEACSATHVWEKRGYYEIKVKAKDSNGAMSEWSDPLPVSMPKNYENLLQTLFEKIFEWVEQLVMPQIFKVEKTVIFW